MSITGLGQGGSLRVQAEAVYDTPIATSQTFLPLAEGTLVYIVEQIAKQNLIGSRVPQAPQDGRKKVGASDLTFEIAPDLMGLFMQLPFGTSSDAGSDAYTHTWLVPISGENAGGSWTVEQFIGSDTGEQFGGVKCTKFMINWDSEATVKIVMTLVGVGADDVAVTRPTTVTVSSNDYYTFCNMVTQITPSGVAQFTQRVNSGEIMVDFGYLDDGQRYQAGSCEAGAPIFGTIPAVTVKLNIDAEKRFETWAQSQHSFKIDVTATSTEIAHGTTPYSFVAEIPAMILDPATNRETALDLISQDLSFTANVGGTTTGSGTDVVQAEIRVVDDTAAYA